ncbi:MAG: class I SAM-dependent methyltransferase [Pseudomonadota bacterium]|nr:class I SAM-dependent methyltransferase [Pseudomonadota bacterium]
MCNVAPTVAAHIHSPAEDPTEAFAERMIDMLNAGATALMTSLGHRAGLFDTMADLPPATSAEIADAAGLNERYVREWLGAMVAADVVELDGPDGRYRLPPAHAACLTRRSAPDNVAVFAQYIPLLGQVEDEILTCFQQGGGVPYERYGRFHEVMAEDSAQTVVAALHEHILPLVPGLTDRLEQGIDVLDIGCGSARALIAMASAYPNSRFTGYDLSDEAIGRGRAEAERLGLANVLLEARDVTELGETESYDLVTAFDAIHDQKSPARVLAGIAHALGRDGVFLMQDIAGSSHHQEDKDHPIGAFLYTISCMHCMSVSLAQGGDGLGAMWGKERALEMLEAAGFGQVEVNRLDHDFQNFFYVARCCEQ